MYNESDPCLPISSYGQSKLNSESILLAELKNSAIVRTVLVYGYANSLSRSNFPLFIKTHLEKGKTLTITADQFRTHTHAEDLAKATMDLALSEHCGIFHIAGPEYLSVFEFALKIAETFQLDSSLLKPIHTEIHASTDKRPLKTGFNISKIQNHIRYHPLSVREGLERMKERMLEINKI